MTRLLALLLAAGCASQPATLTRALHAEPECVRADDHGAVADDGQDDLIALRAALRAAEEGSRRVCLGEGTYHVTRDPRPNKQWIASLIASGIKLAGAGRDRTTISMLGGIVNRRDWRIYDCSGVGCEVRDIAFDGSDRCPGWQEGAALCTGDQTHLVQINGPASDYVIERVRVTLPPLPYGSSGGDCIRLIGRFDAWVTNGVIRDVVGPNCDRSFIGVQRAVDGLLIEDVQSDIVGDQAVDLEPTGETSFDGQDIVRNVIIRRAVLRRGPDAQGPYAIGVNGGGSSTIAHLRIEDSVIEDGGLFVSDVSDMSLVRLRLRNRATRAEPTLLAQKRVQLQLIDTTLERLPGSPPGSVLRVNEHSGNEPERVVMLGGAVVQGAEGVPISTVSLGSLVLVGTKVSFAGADPKHAVVAQGTSGGPPVLVDVRMSGGLLGPVLTAGGVSGPAMLLRVTTIQADPILP